MPDLQPHNTNLLFHVTRHRAPPIITDWLLCVPMLGGDRTGDNRQKQISTSNFQNKHDINKYLGYARLAGVYSMTFHVGKVIHNSYTQRVTSHWLYTGCVNNRQ